MEPYTTVDKMNMPWGETYENVRVDRPQYSFGGTALALWSGDGEALATPTVNLTEYGISPRDNNHVFIKNYSEGEGMLELLEEHKLVKRTNVVVEFGPYSTTATEAEIIF